MNILRNAKMTGAAVAACQLLHDHSCEYKRLWDNGHYGR